MTWSAALKRTVSATALSAAALGFLFAAPATAQTYKWVDEKGVTQYSDTPPPDMSRRANTQLDKQGRAVRQTEAPLTPEQLKQREVELARKQEEAKKTEEQRRRDNALLTTYASDKDFALAEERSLSPVRDRLNGAQARIASITERQQALADEMEFYKAGKKKKGKDAPKGREVPLSLQNEADRLAKEREQIEASIKRSNEDMVAIKERVKADKTRWTELKAAGVSADQAAPKPAPKAASR